MLKPTHWLSRLSLLTYILAHALAAVSLLAFGLRADGWVLHPVALAWYGLFILGSLVLVMRAWQEEASPWSLVVPLLLVLAALGTYPATGLLGGTRYAPYDPSDMLDAFLALNLLSALALTALSLLYRWPRLFLAWAAAQGLLLITYPGWWAGLWRWGGLGAPLPVGALTLGLPVLYALAALALGVRPPRRWGRWLLAGLVVGVALGILAGLRQSAYVQGQGFPPGAIAETWQSFAVEVPLFLTFGALLIPLPLLAGRLLRDRPEQADRRFPWEALVLVLLAAASIAPSFLQPAPAGSLPAAGDIQAWRSSDHVVPDAWLPTIIWVGWLFIAVRWLQLPYALLGLITVLRPGLRPGLALPAFPQALLWAGLGWLAAYAWDFSPLGFPLRVVWETYSPIADSLPLLGGLLLLLAGRAWEWGWGRLADGLWRLMTLGGLLALLLWSGQAAWAYGRILLAPLPAWAERWQYAPLPPALLVGLGLAMHLVLLALGLFALGRTLRAWWEAKVVAAAPGRWSLARAVALPLLALVVLGVPLWWATAPPVVRTVPANGAIGVPRDTVILIEMAPEKRWPGLLLGGSGFGAVAHYADTGDTIQGMSGGIGSGFILDPEGLLRPNAPIEVTVHRTGERPYTLRFTTAGVGGPTATPIPQLAGWPGPVPTAAPTSTPIPDALPTPLPMIYQPTPLPGVPDLVACPDGSDTDETCLPDGWVRLVGYLIKPVEPGQGDFMLIRGPGRAPVLVGGVEGHPGTELAWLRDHHMLTMVEGQVTDLHPPTLMVRHEQAAARLFNRSTPLAELYTNPKLGIALEIPVGWIIEDQTGEGMGGTLAIQNYRSRDLGQPPTDQPDPSLYRVEIVPILPTQATTIAQMRAQIEGRVLREQAVTINGLEAIRLSVDVPTRGRTEIVLAQGPEGVLLFQTWQDPAPFDRMIETLRELRTP